MHRFRAHTRSSRCCVKGQSRQGAATVEFAVVAPILFTLMLGMIDAGQMANVGQVVSCASAFGAREAAKATTDTVGAVEATVVGYIANRFPDLSDEALAAALDVNLLDSTGTPLVDGDLGAVEPGSAVTVELVFQFDDVRWLSGVKVAQGKTLETATVVRRE
jgi:TadE-like protein